MQVRGEGVLGLSRAFLGAGAGAVVVSLWSVDDKSTGTLMNAMYAALLRGARPELQRERGRERERRERDIQRERDMRQRYSEGERVPEVYALSMLACSLCFSSEGAFWL